MEIDGQEKSPIRRELQAINSRGDQCPATYVHYFVDKAGMSLSPAHLEPLAKGIRRYINFHASKEDNEWADQVDRLVSPPKAWVEASMTLREGRKIRDFNPKKANDPNPHYWKKSIKRYNHFAQFATMLNQCVAKAKKEGNLHKPLTAPMSECGYSIEPKTRLRNHAQHRSSNRLMNLVHALSLRRYGAAFEMRAVILYSCTNVNQAWLSELAFSHICQSYTTGAQGFNDYAAGRSNGSSYKNSSEKDWEQAKRIIYGSSNRRLLNDVKKQTQLQVDEGKAAAQPDQDMEELRRFMVGTGDIEGHRGT